MYVEDVVNKRQLIDFEKRIAKRFDEGEIPYLVHFSGGNECRLIDIFKNINPGDYIFSNHRSHYHYLLAGGSPDRLEKLILDGKSMFVFDRKLNFYTSSIVCATPSIAAGVAWALKKKGSNKKVWCFIGDGAEDEGHLYEAAKYVDGWNLPCTFVIEDNDRSVTAGKEERWGTYTPTHFDCVERYNYKSTYPHGGSGNGGWIKFQKKPVLEKVPEKINYVLENRFTSLNYKDAVKVSMQRLAGFGSIFVGYNVRHGSAYGSLSDIPRAQRLETPLAENLMAGLAIGMSLEGLKPVLYFERHDFIFNALDALVNQIEKIETISQGEFKIPVIIKAVVGGIYPFYAGITHTSDYTETLKTLFSFPVLSPMTAGEVLDAYEFALKYQGPVFVSERKDLY